MSVHRYLQAWFVVFFALVLASSCHRMDIGGSYSIERAPFMSGEFKNSLLTGELLLLSDGSFVDVSWQLGVDGQRGRWTNENATVKLIGGDGSVRTMDVVCELSILYLVDDKVAWCAPDAIVNHWYHRPKKCRRELGRNAFCGASGHEN